MLVFFPNRVIANSSNDKQTCTFLKSVFSILPTKLCVFVTTGREYAA